MKKRMLTLAISTLSLTQLYAMQNQQANQSSNTMINIGIDKKNREQVAQILHTLLGSEYVLYVKTQKFHWNVKGPFFGPLHSLFQEQYEMLAKIVDRVAERSLALGIDAPGTMQEFLKMSSISEKPDVNPDDKGMLRQLLNDHETIIRQLHIDIDKAAELGDIGTNNFLTDLLEKHEKAAWMLRAHSQ